MPYSSRCLGGVETWRVVERWGEGQSLRSGVEPQEWHGEVAEQAYHIHVWWIKIGRDTSGVKDLRPKPDQPEAQGSSARKINSHNFWL